MAKETKTIDGIKVTIDPRVFNDYRVAKKMVQVQALSESEDEDNAYILVDFDDLANLVLGRQQFERIQARIAKDNDGIVPSDVVFEFFGKVMTEFAPKNS